MRKSIEIMKCHKCPFFEMNTVEANIDGSIALVKGTCAFYNHAEIWQTTAIKPTWCKVRFTAEEE